MTATYWFDTWLENAAGSDGVYWLIDDGRDYQITDAGGLRRESEITTRCRLRLLTRRGEWFGDPLLGSRLHTIKILKNAKRDAEDYIREALQPLVDEGAILAITVRQIETDHTTGALGVWVEVVVPGDQVIPLGRVPLGGA